MSLGGNNYVTAGNFLWRISKAWNFYASPKGAESSSIAYSIIETAKANNLNVFKYLTYLFKELPNTPFKEEPELLEDYLPWNENVQANCK